MIPPRKEAERILEESAGMNPGPWKSHSFFVGTSAMKIAACCTDMNAEKAYVLGLLHDIGRRFGITQLAHVIDGYRFMTELGYDEAARICITHSFAIKSTEQYIGKRDVTESEFQQLRSLLASYEYDDYDRLIQLCDSIVIEDGAVSLEARMLDVKRRYGSYPESKWKENLRLRDYFEHKTGKTLDEILLPDHILN